jgi:hypothetical protein
MSRPLGKEGRNAAAERVVPLLRNAFASLIRDRRSARLMEGTKNQNLAEATQRFQKQYHDSILEALEGHTSLTLDVMPDAFWFTEHQVLEGTDRKGDMVEMLFTEGVRSFTIENGISLQELDLLGQILTIAWNERKTTEPDLATSLWEADFTRVHFEVVERLDDERLDGESTSISKIEEIIEKLEYEAAETEEAGMLKQDEVEVLLKIREAAGEKQHSADLKVEKDLSPRLSAELAALKNGTDLENSDIPALLGLCLHVVEAPAEAELLSHALIDFLLRQAGSGNTSTAGLHRLLELQDSECTPRLKWRGSVHRAVRDLKNPEFLEALSHLLPLHEEKKWTGFLFSFGESLRDEETLLAIASTLPGWAVRPLGDAVLLREQSSPDPEKDLFTKIKTLLLSNNIGGIQLGMAMSSRLDDARLGEPLLALTAHPDGNVREGALYALRKHPSPRLKTRLQELFLDAFEPVRLEVLRHLAASKDAALARKIEARLQSEDLKNSSEAEIRALCISWGRVLKSEADAGLIALALGQKRAGHQAVPQMALQGLKASNTKAAHAGLQRVITESPRLATEAEAVLRELGA